VEDYDGDCVATVNNAHNSYKAGACSFRHQHSPAVEQSDAHVQRHFDAADNDLRPHRLQRQIYYPAVIIIPAAVLVLPFTGIILMLNVDVVLAAFQEGKNDRCILVCKIKL